MPNLVVDITGHGFGHAGQTAPVVEALRNRHPNLCVTIRSRVPRAQLEQLFAPGFAMAEPPPDLGMAMHSPVSVDRAASFAWYERLQAGWGETIEGQARTLEALAPDLLFSNVGFVGLAAAARAGIPSIAMSSLNWADIVQGYGAAPLPLIERMREAYRSARAFVLVTPHMPTVWADNRVTVGPVGRKGTDRRAEIARSLGLDPAKPWVVVSFGGIPMGDLATTFPRLEEVEWIVDIAPLEGMRSIRDLEVPFIDLIASADIVVTKTGYGLFVEPAAHGLFVIYRRRPDWPESPYLEGWLRSRQIGEPLPESPDELASLILSRGRRSPPLSIPSGIDAAADIVEALLYPGDTSRVARSAKVRRSAGG